MAKEQISRTQSVLEAQAILRYSNLHNQNLSLLSGGNPAHHFSEAQLKKALDITMADVAVDIEYSKRIAAEWEKCVALKDCLYIGVIEDAGENESRAGIRDGAAYWLKEFQMRSIIASFTTEEVRIRLEMSDE